MNKRLKSDSHIEYMQVRVVNTTRRGRLHTIAFLVLMGERAVPGQRVGMHGRAQGKLDGLAVSLRDGGLRFDSEKRDDFA